MASAALAERPGRAAERTDHQLVSDVRSGDDRAFEQLYSRYQRRITAYVYGMVRDHGRAEDITQEVFVSALRRMRQTERPIAFKPWIYEIAKNACIDAYRRAKRAEEVSFDADDRLSPSDHTRLVANEPQPDAAVDAKQELDHLCGAFGGLSDSHHEILVLRELEGLSYKDIGERMGMSRPAVESTLFRARKRLGEEYDELVSGARCLRIQELIADGGAELGRRDQRKLARHVSHCQPCRLLAVRAGLDIPVPARRRLADKIGAILPLPGFLRFRRGAGAGEASTPLSGGGGAWITHMPSLAEALSSGWGKAAAGLATLLVAGAGVGVTTYADGAKRDERGTGYRATEVRSASGGGSASDTRSAGAAGNLQRGGGSDGAAGGGGAAGGSGSGAGGGGRADAQGPGSGNKAPSKLPAAVKPVTDAVKPVTDAVKPLTNATKPVTDAVKPVTDATKPVTDAVKPVTDATKPVTDATKPVTDAAQPVTDAAKPVTDAAKPVTDAAKPVTDAAKPVTGAAEPVTDPVGDAAGGLPVP